MSKRSKHTKFQQATQESVAKIELLDLLNQHRRDFSPYCDQSEIDAALSLASRVLSARKKLAGLNLIQESE